MRRKLCVDRIVAINDANLDMFMLQPGIDDLIWSQTGRLELAVHHLLIEHPVDQFGLAVDRIAGAGRAIMVGIDYIGDMDDISEYNIEQFKLEGYQSHPAIKAPLSN